MRRERQLAAGQQLVVDTGNVLGFTGGVTLDIQRVKGAKNIVFGLTGTGYFDMYAYESFNNGTMTDYIPTDEELEAGFAALPKI